MTAHDRRRWVFWMAGIAGAALASSWWMRWWGIVAWVCGTLAWLALGCRGRPPAPREDDSPVADDIDDDCPTGGDAGDVESLVDGMLRQDRYALLLRRQVVGNLSLDQFAQARETLEDRMALVPEGQVTLARPDSERIDDRDTAEEQRFVQPLFLDRYPVTNARYHQFVKADGYQQMPLWDPQIWPAVLDFVDASGSPGPRFWKNGKFARGEAEHPVVGVSWYEAAAYARWVGKRLPSEAEWVKAANWPVPLSEEQQWQRKFPWGDTMDRQRCNLWGSGPGRIVAVTEYASGVSVGGVYQLIGNVWEWTSGMFGVVTADGEELSLPMPMKSIRGGAFDTYFENQATCQFESGENPLARKHNIGFRCALGLCDVASHPGASDESLPVAQPPSAVVDVAQPSSAVTEPEGALV